MAANWSVARYEAGSWLGPWRKWARSTSPSTGTRLRLLLLMQRRPRPKTERRSFVETNPTLTRTCHGEGGEAGELASPRNTYELDLSTPPGASSTVIHVFLEKCPVTLTTLSRKATYQRQVPILDHQSQT